MDDRPRPNKKLICGIVHQLTRCNLCGEQTYTKAGMGRVISRYVCKTCQELPGDAENQPERYCRWLGDDSSFD